MENILCNDLVACGGGVSFIALHHAGHAVDVLQQEGKHGDVVFVRDLRVIVVELLDIIRTVVGGQGDAGESDLGARLLQGGDDLVEVVAGIADRQTAQAIVASELYDDEDGMKREHIGEARDAVFGCVSGDAEVFYVVLVTELVEIFLKVVGVALARICAQTRGEGITEAYEDRAVVVGWVRCRCGGGKSGFIRGAAGN